MSRIVLDGMGGDLAPAAAVAGAVAAARTGVEVLLVGREEEMRAEVKRLGGAPALEVVHAADVVAMGEHDAREAVRRRESSIAVGLQLVKDGRGDAFVSAGNTGAVLATALVRLGRLPRVERPAIATLIPASAGEFLLLDAGANADCRSSHLLQFAHLGARYMQAVRGVAEPRVGLLNIGSEPTKGSQLAVEVYDDLAASNLRFIGNVEGRDLTSGLADVVVTDGFTGNVVLKLAEGVIAMMLDEIRNAAMTSLRARIGGLLLRPAARQVRDRLDYRQHGAAPLLGLAAPVFIAHGSSDARAIESSILRAAEAVDAGVIEALAGALDGLVAAPGRPGGEAEPPPEERAG